MRKNKQVKHLKTTLSHNPSRTKTKTLSSVLQTEFDHLPHTKIMKNKKNIGYSRVPSVGSLRQSTKIHHHKHQNISQNKPCSLVQHKSTTINKENIELRQEYCQLQQKHIKSKTKIQTLLHKLSQFTLKIQQNKSKCINTHCHEHKQALQKQLHSQRMKVHGLECEKSGWQQNKYEIKEKYRKILKQIQIMRSDQ